MKVRTTIAGTAFRAKLTAVCWGALTILAPVAVSACDGSTSTPTVPSFSPTVATLPASDGSTPSTPGVTSTATVSPVTTVTQTVTVPAATATSFVPTAAPVTGGGGTAGLQDGLLFVLGAAAILAGAGSILYRKRFTRHR
jgi:hypothetical protein